MTRSQVQDARSCGCSVGAVEFAVHGPVQGQTGDSRCAHCLVVWLFLRATLGDPAQARLRREGRGAPAEPSSHGRPTRVTRRLSWWQLKRATAEWLLLLDAAAGLGPGLVVLYRHPDGDPAQRLTRLKGGNDPAGRAPDSLRSVAGSPNRLLTMVHTSDDPADVVRELAVFLPWRERAALVTSARACGSPSSSSAVLDVPLATVRSAYAGQAADGAAVKAPQWRGKAFAALPGDIAVPDVTRRWPAVAQWSRQVPLLTGGQPR